jgi:hypothetical protein
MYPITRVYQKQYTHTTLVITDNQCWAVHDFYGEPPVLLFWFEK